MRESNLVGVVRIVRNGKEHVCVIRPYIQGMILHTLYWIDEIRGMAFPQLPVTDEAEIEMAKQLIRMLTAEWDPEQYKVPIGRRSCSSSLPSAPGKSCQRLSYPHRKRQLSTSRPRCSNRSLP